VPVTRRHSTWLGSRLSRHPHERYQLCYRPGTRQRSAGIFLTRRRALAEKRVIERGRIELAVAADFDLKQKARTLFGEFVATKWWPAWKDQHPTAEDGTRKKVEKRILPALGDIPLGDLDQAPSAPGSPPGGAGLVGHPGRRRFRGRRISGRGGPAGASRGDKGGCPSRGSRPARRRALPRWRPP
jgi:hypothetical protein